jgi:branched-chain amino acid transport system substrate-binding protein
MVYDELRQWTSYMPAELLFSSPAFLGGSIPKSQQGPIQQFTSVMKEAGVVPDLAVALPWDPAMIVISALQKVGPSATAAQIQAYIANLHGYPGILGVYDFRTGNQRGLTQGDMTVVRWDAKQSTWLAVSRPGGDPI